MNPFSKRIHQIKNPDLDLPKGTRNPFLDLKSVFGFTERNTPWVFPCQILLTSGGRCNLYFEDVRLKICRLLYFCMLFRVPAKIVFPKSILFSFLRKVDHVVDQLLQKAYGEENCDVTLPWEHNFWDRRLHSRTKEKICATILFLSGIMHRKVEHVNFSFFPAICVGPRFFCYHGNMTLRLLLSTS